MTDSVDALFSTPLPGIKRPLSNLEADQITKYLNLLTKWQKTHRLVGSVELGWLIENVVMDSLSFLEVLPPAAQHIADIGSGAGVPGISIAITRPNIGVTLVEPRRRRASFLATVIRELGLHHVHVAGVRVEALGASYTESFDAAVMRCAGSVESILPEVFRIVRKGGTVVAASAPGQSPERAGGAVEVAAGPGRVRTLRVLQKPLSADP